MPEMTAVEALFKCGEALYGQNWLRRTAKLVGMSPTTFSKWRGGKTKAFDSRHSIFPVLAYKMRIRAKELEATAAEIDAWRDDGR
jgi:hypothetical protein